MTNEANDQVNDAKEFAPKTGPELELWVMRQVNKQLAKLPTADARARVMNWAYGQLDEERQQSWKRNGNGPQLSAERGFDQ